MFIALVILHVLVALGLIFVVLLQSGRGAELGAAFGGTGQATFGRGPATFITKFTTGLAVIFMATSLSLAFLTIEHPSNSIIDSAPLPASAETPQTGALATPAPAQSEDTAQAPAAAAEAEPATPAPAPLEQQDAPPRNPSQSN